MRKLITILTFAIISLSCNKSEKKHSSLSEINTDSMLKKSLKLEFIYRTNKSDVFKIMMNNIEVDELQKKNIHIFEDVTPTSNNDRIIAEFDANNMSKNILINLGNKEVKEIEIINISLSYGENFYSFNTAKDINKYFAFNRFVDTDEDSKILKTKKIDGKHNPAIVLRQNLIRLLNKE